MCGSPVMETREAIEYSCCKCKFAIRKNILEPLGKKNISGSEAKQLLSGKTLMLNGLKGKGGKSFDAEWKLQKHGY